MKLAALLMAIAIPATAETPCSLSVNAIELAGRMNSAMMQSHIQDIETLASIMRLKPSDQAVRDKLLSSFEASKNAAAQDAKMVAEFTDLSLKISAACP
jgi:hypothetical protein